MSDQPSIAVPLPAPQPTITITLTPPNLVNIQSNITPDLQGYYTIAQACLDAAQMALKQIPPLLQQSRIVIPTPELQVKH